MKQFLIKNKTRIIAIIFTLYSLLSIGLLLYIQFAPIAYAEEVKPDKGNNLYDIKTYRDIYQSNTDTFILAAIPIIANCTYSVSIGDVFVGFDVYDSINLSTCDSDTSNFTHLDYDLHTEKSEGVNLTIENDMVTKDCYLYIWASISGFIDESGIEATVTDLCNSYSYVPDQIVVLNLDYPDNTDFPYDKDAALGKNLFNSYNNVNSDLVTGLFDLVDYNSVKSSINLYYNHSLLYPIPNSKCVLSFDLSFESKFDDLESVNFCVRYVNKDNLSEYVDFHNFEVLLNSKQHIEIPLESYDYFTIAYSNVLDLGIYLISNIQLESGEVATAYEPFFSYNSIVEQEYNDGFSNSYEEGYLSGHSDGFDKGYILGEKNDIGDVFSKSIGSIADFLYKLLSIEVWGITLFDIVGTVGAVLIVVMLVKMFAK